MRKHLTDFDGLWLLGCITSYSLNLCEKTSKTLSVKIFVVEETWQKNIIYGKKIKGKRKKENKFVNKIKRKKNKTNAKKKIKGS